MSRRRRTTGRARSTPLVCLSFLLSRISSSSALETAPPTGSVEWRYKLAAASLSFLGSIDDPSSREAGANSTCEGGLPSFASFGSNDTQGSEALPPMPEVTLRITLPTEDSKVFGSTAPLTVELESSDDEVLLDHYGDRCLVHLSDNPRGGLFENSLLLHEYLNFTRKDGKDIKMGWPMFYPTREDCMPPASRASAGLADGYDLCYDLQLMPGPREVWVYLMCLLPGEPSVSIAASTHVRYSASQNIPPGTSMVALLQDPELTTITLNKRRRSRGDDSGGAGGPLHSEEAMAMTRDEEGELAVRLTVDFHRAPIEQAAEFCAEQGRSAADCIPRLESLLRHKQDEGYNAYAQALFSSVQREASSSVRFMEGTIFYFPKKLELLKEAVRRPNVKTVCEIGFNCGHSSLAFLLFGAPDLRVFAFDIGEHAYTPLAAHFMHQMLGRNRFSLTLGASEYTVPAFSAMHSSQRCDLIFIDGGHMYPVVMQDIANMQALANRTSHQLIIDDSQADDVARAIKDSEAAGLIRTNRDTATQGVDVFISLQPRFEVHPNREGPASHVIEAKYRF